MPTEPTSETQGRDGTGLGFVLGAAPEAMSA